MALYCIFFFASLCFRVRYRAQFRLCLGAIRYSPVPSAQTVSSLSQRPTSKVTDGSEPRNGDAVPGNCLTFINSLAFSPPLPCYTRETRVSVLAVSFGACIRISNAGASGAGGGGSSPGVDITPVRPVRLYVETRRIPETPPRHIGQARRLAAAKPTSHPGAMFGCRGRACLPACVVWRCRSPPSYPVLTWRKRDPYGLYAVSHKQLRTLLAMYAVCPPHSPCI